MTVAAYSRGLLAADTCYTHFDDDGTAMYRVRESKITVIRDIPGFTLAIVTAGDDAYTATYERAVRAAFTEMDRHKPPKELELVFDQAFDLTKSPSAIIMFRGDACAGAYAGEVMLRLVGDGYAAIGCDAPVALGALYAGADVITAVKAGAFHGTMSGTPVESLCSTFFEVRRDSCM